MRALTGHEVEPTLIMREARSRRPLPALLGRPVRSVFETIQELMQISDVAEAADRLIELALRGGGPDNVTVVVADVVDYDYGQTQPILAGAVSVRMTSSSRRRTPRPAAHRRSSPRRNEPDALCRNPGPPPKPRSKRRLFIAATLLILVVLAGLAIGREIVRSNYYVSQHDGTVSIMRGVQGSFLGYSLQEPYLLGCLNARNELSLISADQPQQNLGCRMLGVADMRPSRRAQVIAEAAVRHPRRRDRPDRGEAQFRPSRLRRQARRRPPAHRHRHPHHRPPSRPKRRPAVAE